ncbi:hypothetical protein [Luteimonas vadosa]|uniref:Uncharacterized protein n=1 Tax=Luteimonas vadosa TaxID=1165507 RepID=A0ABP9E7M9_9GAMM
MPTTEPGRSTQLGGAFALAIVLAIVGTLVFGSPPAAAIELPNLDQFAALHGRYAPDGDCSGHPRITVDGNGLGIENGDSRYRMGRFEHAANHGGVDYAGMSVWLMPLQGSERPLLLTFNSKEQPGVLAIEPYERGWDGGRPLSARHQRLVDASPYRLCGHAQDAEANGQDPDEKDPAGAGSEGI